MPCVDFFRFLGFMALFAVSWPATVAAQSVDFKVGPAARQAVEDHLKMNNPAYFAGRYQTEKAKAFPLVIFIPGILGSKLEMVMPGTDKPQTLWGIIRTWDLIVAPDISYSEDQTIQASPLHDFTTASIRRDIYGGGIEYISNQRFSDTKTLLAFGYDWRQDNEKSANHLHAFLCRNAAEFKDRPVVFAAHSMGGLVLKSWFVRHYKDGVLTCSDAAAPVQIKVTEVIFLGTPHMGSPKAIKSFAVGFQLATDNKTLFGSLFGKIDVNTLARALNTHGATFPSVYQLLPIYGWQSCLQRVADDPPDPILVNTSGTIHNKFDLFSAQAWRRVGWPQFLPTNIDERKFYEEVLPRHLQRAKSFLCEVARFRFPTQIAITYFYGQDKDAATDQTFVLENVKADELKRGSATFRHKDGGYAWGDGTVLSSIASNSWFSSHRDRHFSPDSHSELLKSRAFLEYLRSLIDSAQARTETALISDTASRGELFAAYAATNALASLPLNATQWNNPGFAEVTKFNDGLLEKKNIDAKRLIMAAGKKDARQKAALLAVAATSKSATSVEKAQAAGSIAEALLALGDWVAASDTVNAATSLAQAVESKQQRDAILRSAYRTGGWAHLQLGQSEKGNGFLLNAERLGNAKAFVPPPLVGTVPRNDMVGKSVAVQPRL